MNTVVTAWWLVWTPLALLVLHDFFRYFLRPSWKPVAEVVHEFGWRRVIVAAWRTRKTWRRV